jgi:predicted ATPase
MRDACEVLSTVAVANYRSLRDLRIELGPVTVITGANGTGKSSLYRALRLLADCASGEVIGSVAREGGLPSVLWAGPERLSRSVRAGDHPVQGTTRSGPVNLQLGFAGDEFSYLIDLGLPTRDGRSSFNLDPEVKRELVWAGPLLRPGSTLVRRTRRLVEVRDESGRDWLPYDRPLQTYESLLAEVVDPYRAPELIALREQVRSWRFYDQFRTDAAAPARMPQIGTRTPILDHEGRDLAASIQTIVEVGDSGLLQACVADAFPGSQLEIAEMGGRFELLLHVHGLLRPLTAAELSDGTLRYLLLIAALLSPRPPALMVLNEPETSLHPELRGPLARLIIAAAARSQLIVVTHATDLVDTLAACDAVRRIEFIKDFGETRVAGVDWFDQPSWSWGTR